jgi:hypothetical protein
MAPVGQDTMWLHIIKYSLTICSQMATILDMIEVRKTEAFAK